MFDDIRPKRVPLHNFDMYALAAANYTHAACNRAGGSCAVSQYILLKGGASTHFVVYMLLTGVVSTHRSRMSNSYQITYGKCIR